MKEYINETIMLQAIQPITYEIRQMQQNLHMVGTQTLPEISNKKKFDTLCLHSIC
jgi:hypothetical protein